LLKSQFQHLDEDHINTVILVVNIHRYIDDNLYNLYLVELEMMELNINHHQTKEKNIFYEYMKNFIVTMSGLIYVSR
jgi:hypothetical protein